MLLGKTLLLPALEESKPVRLRVFLHEIKRIVASRHGPGRHGHHNKNYRLCLKVYGPDAGVEKRAHEIPQCLELIADYRSEHILQNVASRQMMTANRCLQEEGNPGLDPAKTR